MTPKEDQQPMTTREELVALADNLDTYAKRYSGDWANALPGMSWSRLEMIVNALRLASRQEVSVTVEELATLLIDCWKSGKAPLQVARALLAKYSITKRTTEG